MWEVSLEAIRKQVDTSRVNLDGTHTPATKGGQSVAYQHRKRAKTTNLLVVVDFNGYVLAASPFIADNHHDAFQLDTHLRQLVRDMKGLDLLLQHPYFNADGASDTKSVCKYCFNHHPTPNIVANTGNQNGD